MGDLSVLRGGVEVREGLDFDSALEALQDGFTAVTFTRKGCVISVAPVDEGDAEARAVKLALLAVGTAKQQAEAGTLLRPP